MYKINIYAIKIYISEICGHIFRLLYSITNRCLFFTNRSYFKERTEYTREHNYSKSISLNDMYKTHHRYAFIYRGIKMNIDGIMKNKFSEILLLIDPNYYDGVYTDHIFIDWIEFNKKYIPNHLWKALQG